MSALEGMPQVMTTAELAKALRVSKASIYAEARAGRLVPIIVSERVWRWSRASVEAWIAAQRHTKPESET